MLNRLLLGAAVLLGQSACLASYDQSTPSSVHPNTSTSDTAPEVRPEQPSDTTSLWMQYGDPAAIAAAAQNLGPLEVSSRMHGCNKFKFHTLGDVMANLGVNMGNNNQALPTPPASPPGTIPPAPPAPNLLPIETFFATGSTYDCTPLVPIPSGVSPTDQMDVATHIAQPARYLYCSGRLTLGMPPYPARLSESTVLTTAGVTKLFDTLAAAAVELVANNLKYAVNCTDTTGAQAVLFNPDFSCNANGVACLQGYPPSEDELNLCNRMVNNAAGAAISSVKLDSGMTVPIPAIAAITAGEQIAAAAILANALLCE